MWDVASLTSSGGEVHSELGLIVLFVCNLYIFLPAPFRKKRQALWPLTLQRWGPGGGMKAEPRGRSHCNMWLARLGQAKRFFFNWPCNLPQLGWITRKNSSLEREWGDWHTADCGQRGQGAEREKTLLKLNCIVLLFESNVKPCCHKTAGQ